MKMEFKNITEGMSSEEMIKVLDHNRMIASKMVTFVAEGEKILNSEVNTSKVEEIVCVEKVEKKQGFVADPAVNMEDVSYYLGIVKNYQTDGDMSSELSLILPDNKPLILRVAAEILKEEKEAYEFVLDYAKETGADDEEIQELSSEAILLGEKRKALLAPLGTKKEDKGYSYTKKQGDI